MGNPRVRIVPRSGSYLAGQFTIFSSLNVVAARLARHGDEAAAVRLAAAATELEALPEFDILGKLLAELPMSVAKEVVDGAMPDEPPAKLLDALRSVARITERARERALGGAKPADFLAGRVKEVHDTHGS